jgi:hypothetical protein
MSTTATTRPPESGDDVVEKDDVSSMLSHDSRVRTRLLSRRVKRKMTANKIPKQKMTTVEEDNDEKKDGQNGISRGDGEDDM